MKKLVLVGLVVSLFQAPVFAQEVCDQSEIIDSVTQALQYFKNVMTQEGSLTNPDLNEIDKDGSLSEDPRFPGAIRALHAAHTELSIASRTLEDHKAHGLCLGENVLTDIADHAQLLQYYIGDLTTELVLPDQVDVALDMFLGNAEGLKAAGMFVAIPKELLALQQLKIVRGSGWVGAGITLSIGVGSVAYQMKFNPIGEVDMSMVTSAAYALGEALLLHEGGKTVDGEATPIPINVGDWTPGVAPPEGVGNKIKNNKQPKKKSSSDPRDYNPRGGTHMVW